MPGAMSIGGLSSGIQTDAIITKYMELARGPQKTKQADQATAQQKLMAWQDLNTRVLALQTKSEAISSATAFAAKTATSSMEDMVKVTASSDATSGTYYLNVNKTAKSHQIASQTYSGLDDTVSQGTILINVEGNSTDITIDSSNNTLLGVKDAINKSYAGVSASVINEGTANSPAYRLLLTSKETGSDHKMIIDAGATGINIGVDQDGVGNRDKVVQAAEDAEIMMGTLTFKRSSNTITDIIPGVTLNVANPDATKTIKIEVTKDTTAAKTAVNDFVAQYNDIMRNVKEMTSYDKETGDTGIFLGDLNVQSLQMDLESMVTSSVSGIPFVPGKQTYNALSSIGITTGTDGLLTVNDADLSAALANNSEDVGKLFGTTLTAESPYITLVSSNSDTKPSGFTGYDINITQPATKTWIRSGKDMTGGAILAADEVVTINGKDITLEKDFTLAQVMAEINKYTVSTSVSAFETILDGKNYLSFRSLQYGNKDITISSPLSNAAGGTSGIGNVKLTSTAYTGQGGLGDGAAGKDVAGTINGESCTGRGQILTVDSGENSSSPVKGLQIMATNTTALNTNATFIKGVGSSIKERLTSMTGLDGLFSVTQKSLTSEVDVITTEIADMETNLTAQQDAMYAKFNAMEVQLSRLQSQGDYLAAQLGSLSNNN
ncbi:MAG: flagellar filament capping protein FliD [Armatimonadetes bacterium]|nr:flagellar filament capping protein FliD [Armatimonadota bacterium]